MDNTLTYILVGICFIVIATIIFSKPLKLILKAVVNSTIGLFAFIGMNFLLTPLDISVGINLLTLLIVGILGVPGFISLYLCQWFL